MDGQSVAERRKSQAAAGKAARDAEEARYKQSAKDLDAMKKNTVSRTDDDLLDDVVDGQSVAERRKQQAASGQAARDAEEARYKQSAKDLDAMKKNTAARTDDDLLDDVVDGQSVAERRKEQAAAGKAARDAEEARYKQSAKDLDAMKKNTAARTDDDLLDDVVDGQSVAERRKQQAAAGQAARDAEEARYKQSAKDLDAMKKNTAARTDHDLLDDPV